MELQIEFDVASAVRKMQGVVNRLHVFDEFFDDAEKYLAMQTRQQFETEGARLGTPWPRLKASTIQSRMRQGNARAMLVNTGDLKGSFEVVERGNLHLVWSSRIPYYKYHQKGTRHMKARKMVGYNMQTTAELKILLALFLKSAANG